MTSEQYARQAGEFIPPALRTPMGLYPPVAVRALELGVFIRDEGNDADEVIVIAGALLRYLLAPAASLGAGTPRPDFGRIDKIWLKPSASTRHLGALRDFQLLAAAYVSNGAALSADPLSRARRLATMAQEVHGMVEHLAVILGHHGYSLGHAAHRDLEALVARAETAALATATR